MSDIELNLHIWRELKSHLIGGDVQAAAEDFVRVLIENGANAEDIAQFAIDAEVKLALAEYIELDADEFEEDEEYDD